MAANEACSVSVDAVSAVHQPILHFALRVIGEFPLFYSHTNKFYFQRTYKLFYFNLLLQDNLGHVYNQIDTTTSWNFECSLTDVTTR
jgi:hypothetical protein